MKGTWQHDAKIEVRALRRVPGHEAEGRRRRVPDLPAARARRTPTCLPTTSTSMTADPDREPVHRAERPGRPVPAAARRRRSSSSRSRRSTTEFAKPEVRKAISMAIDRDEITSRSSRTRRRRRARSSRRSSPATARTPAARPASSTRPRPRSCTTAAGGPAKIKITYNARRRPQGLGRRDLQPAQGEPGRGVRRRARAEVRRPADQGRGQEARRHVPHGLGHGLPVDGELPRPAVLDQRLVELLRLQQPASSTTLVEEGAAAPTPDEAIKKYQAAEDILAKDMPVIPLRFGAEQLRPLDQGQERRDRPVQPGRPHQDRSRSADRPATVASRAGPVAPPPRPATTAASTVPDLTRLRRRRGCTHVPLHRAAPAPDGPGLLRDHLHRVRADVRRTRTTRIQALAGERPVTDAPARRC